MGSVLFNAFSFLQKKLKNRQIPCVDAAIEIEDGQTVAQFLDGLGLSSKDVEGVFVNGRISPLDTRLYDKDRVALLPPGTPGPYRLLLGLVSSSGKKQNSDK